VCAAQYNICTDTGMSMKNKQRKNWLIPLVLIISAIFCHVGYSAEKAFQEFSADMVSRSGRQIVQAKFYVSGDKMRTEMPGNVVIMRLDKNLTWIIMLQQRMYMEQALKPKDLPKTSKELGGEIERVSLGMDTVGGKPAEKFKVVYVENSARLVVYQWIRDSKFPVKIEAENGSWSVEYKNLFVGPQPAALFELPPGLQKLSMPFDNKL